MKKQQNFQQPSITTTYAGEFAGQAKYQPALNLVNCWEVLSKIISNQYQQKCWEGSTTRFSNLNRWN